MNIVYGTMSSIYRTMRIAGESMSSDGRTMSSTYETRSISGVTMSSGRKVVEPCTFMEPWELLVEP